MRTLLIALGLFFSGAALAQESEPALGKLEVFKQGPKGADLVATITVSAAAFVSEAVAIQEETLAKSGGPGELYTYTKQTGNASPVISLIREHAITQSCNNKGGVVVLSPGTVKEGLWVRSFSVKDTLLVSGQLNKLHGMGRETRDGCFVDLPRVEHIPFTLKAEPGQTQEVSVKQPGGIYRIVLTRRAAARGS